MGEIQVTSNYDFIQDNWEDNNIFIMEGSTRSGKTIAIVQWIILQAINSKKPIVIRCYRHDSTTHDKGAIADMDLVLGPSMMNLRKGNGPKDHYTKNSQTKVYKFFNGSEISFSATNDTQKLHGPGADITWLNEVMEISHEAYKQIAFRTRGKIIMDFNPSYNRHWVFNAFKNRPGVAKNRSTYKDNEFLTEEQVYEIESTNPDDPRNVAAGTADAYEWAVYGLGMRGQIKGAVFTNWEETEFWPSPEVCHEHGFGMDFGFQVSPTAVAECCIHNRAIYVRERLYKTNYLIRKEITRPDMPSVQGFLEDENIGKQLLICADQANPTAITELSELGYNIIGVSKVSHAQKGWTKNSSILNGISLMKKFKIYVHTNSPNLLHEFEHYRWKEHTYKDGDTQLEPMPIKKDDHLIDAIRYWCMQNLRGNLANYGPTVVVDARKPFTEKGYREVKNRARERKIM